MPPTTQKKIIRTIRRPKPPNPSNPITLTAVTNTPTSNPSPPAPLPADTTTHTLHPATLEPSSITSEPSSTTSEPSSIEPPAESKTLAAIPAETASDKPVAKPGTKIIKRVKKIVRKKVLPTASEPLSLDTAEKKTSSESSPAPSAGLEIEAAVSVTPEPVSLELKVGPLIQHVSVEAAGLESSETKPVEAKSRTKIVKVVRKVVRKKAAPEPPLSVADASPTVDGVGGAPEPEAEKETVAVDTSVSSVPDSELVSEKAPLIEALSTEGLAVEPTEAGLKAVKRVRKVVRKKIVKKLVPKGSLTAKKVDAIPKLEDRENTAKCGEVSSPIQDNSVRREAAGSLPETKDKDSKLSGIKLVSNRLKSQMEEAGKVVSVESDNTMKSKRHCDQVKAKGDILDGRKSGERAEVVSELKEDDLDVLSERRKRRRTEIFVGGLDRSAKEEDLKRVFGKVGEILEVRIMMDGQTGKNKGYAFMRYAEPSQAKRAVAELSKVEICGKTCGAAAVQSDAIFIGNIDKKWRDEDVIKLLKEAGVENIDTVKVVMDSNNTDSNRGYAFLELETNADAQRAYKKLQKKDFLGKGRNIKVSWSDSFTIPDEEEMKKVKSVYVEGVPDSWDEAKLMDSFKKFGEIERIVLSKNIKSAKRRDFAFINYKTREAALSCIRTFRNEEPSDNGSKINLKVELAKRVEKVKQIKGQNSTNNYVLKEKYNPVQGLISQDNSPAVPSAKRTFSSLGNDTLYSDFRGYARSRLDGSFGLPGSSYGMMSHGLADSSLSHYQHRPLRDTYSTGSLYGSGGHEDQIIREGAAHAGSLYPRFRSNMRDGNEFLWRL